VERVDFMPKKGYLILENGTIIEGNSFGSEKEVKGEVVFNTGMVGYPEGFTDPSYFGQILTLTYPIVGNYGVPETKIQNGLPLNFESRIPQIRGLIISDCVREVSHWQVEYSLSEWLINENIPALYDIDTRTLTKTIREFGVMKGIITFSKPRNISGLIFYDINSENLAPNVSCQDIKVYGNGKYRILLIDCGLKNNQIRMLLKHDTTVIRVPWNYDPYIENNIKFDAIFVSNGPGDARNMRETVLVLKKSLERKIPIFGICLGNQLLALAAGGDIYKLKYGHRSQNQPVQDLKTGECFITTQNHGFAVVENSLPSNWVPWFKNLNDDTNEGVHHKTLPFFSVQFHPESAPGPTDTEWLFDYFIEAIKQCKRKN
jgi:carbamoyl-phosphate synthase small subunit